MIKLQRKSRIINNDETLTLYRSTGSTYEDAKLVQGSETSHEIKCNVQPLSDRDLMIVPEGDRFKEQYWIYTNPENSIKVNDRVVRCGINYQVQGVQPWGSFARARIMRNDVGGNASN